MAKRRGVSRQTRVELTAGAWRMEDGGGRKIRCCPPCHHAMPRHTPCYGDDSRFWLTIISEQMSLIANPPTPCQRPPAQDNRMAIEESRGGGFKVKVNRYFRERVGRSEEKNLQCITGVHWLKPTRRRKRLRVYPQCNSDGVEKNKHPRVSVVGTIQHPPLRARWPGALVS